MNGTTENLQEIQHNYEHTSLLNSRHEHYGREINESSASITKNEIKTQEILEPFAYLKTKHFWIVLALGQVLALCITSTNTFSSYIANSGNSSPALQSLSHYILLVLVFLPYTISQMGGFIEYWKMLKSDGWKFILLSLADTQGNYFIVKAYRYTNLLSVALLDNMAIAFVVLFSYWFLNVRYKWSQYTGIGICILGVFLIILSNVLMSEDDSLFEAVSMLKGDLFVILSTSCYGAANVIEEFLVSKRPVYEVLSQMGLFGTIIISCQFFLFENESFENIQWSISVFGYFAGFSLSLFLMYVLTPLMFRMSSSAFYNISLLTSDFWALIIGVHVFGYKIFWLYPVGFVFTIAGVVCYYLIPTSIVGDSFKPWLGEHQEHGIVGLGTAAKKRQNIDNENNVV